MKLLSTSVFLLIIQLTALNAQTTIGTKVGISSYTWNINNFEQPMIEEFARERKTGVQFTAFVEMSVGNLPLRAEVGYVRKGAVLRAAEQLELDTRTVDIAFLQDIKINYLELAILGKQIGVERTPEHNFGVDLLYGITLGYALNGHIIFDYSEQYDNGISFMEQRDEAFNFAEERYRQLDIGGVIGLELGYFFTEQLALSLEPRFSLGINNLLLTEDDNSVRNVGLNLLLGIKYEL